MNTTSVGNYGEDAACEYLINNGYKIVKRNYKCKLAEIDIVAYDSNKVLCFIEVKTRKNNYYGNAYEAVNSDKIKHIKKGAICFVREYKINCEMRFDVIEIYGRLKDGEFLVDEMNHFEDAF